MKIVSRIVTVHLYDSDERQLKRVVGRQASRCPACCSFHRFCCVVESVDFDWSGEDSASFSFGMCPAGCISFFFMCACLSRVRVCWLCPAGLFMCAWAGLILLEYFLSSPCSTRLDFFWLRWRFGRGCTWDHAQHAWSSFGWSGCTWHFIYG